MFLLVLAHPGCPRESAESREMVMCVCVKVLKTITSIFEKSQWGNTSAEKLSLQE